MNHQRRTVLKGVGSAAAVGVAVAAGLLKPTAAFASDRAAFDAKGVDAVMKAIKATGAADSKDIVVKAPDIAENGAVVPVEVTSNIAGTNSIAIIAEKNATPMVGEFELSNGATGYISTRIKLANTSNVRAVVKAGGKVFTAAKEVKVTIGGCGG
ncbi:thiosulfate-binding protein SoxY [Sulfuritortus calidifontis]|uniref:Thiosulfate-binding protein SoxY n=1 Tax=Sulfuritortus calidifontis TaxID=1914471 RepID=A0A4R3JZC6_9PROT|nr:thiosulfate oxidation carrier protein SoxY [Sulfuritortus calidifontis]TCS73101.1 thiosulfate-binding protein SoxY [Sulfuritortus calidifontis]